MKTPAKLCIAIAALVAVGAFVAHQVPCVTRSK